jgi:hypothetical protein
MFCFYIGMFWRQPKQEVVKKLNYAHVACKFVGYESVSSPPSGFWCLNDKTIKELMSFAKYETGKMSCNHVKIICSLRHVLWL